ncbi:MAG: hypothetical protein A3J38_09235 [Gammaproteobacteria bacterium RIFCSPHIGHO2_12_FULL_45_9]|nr:MAG: hypothetical protein A3J38_09235 [Gammaproteobacteria bacterium RIFCSPHIGHO2_12_FULL_45_9]
MLGRLRKQEGLQTVSKIAFLEEAIGMRLIVRGAIWVGGMLLLLLLWAALAPIAEVTPSQGQLVPEGDVYVIQHLEGGIIQQINVSDGDYVQKGQILAKIDPTRPRAEFAKLQSQEVSLILDVDRLHAFLAGKPASSLTLEKFTQFLEARGYNVQDITPLVQDEQLLLKSQYQNLQDQKATLQSVLDQRQEQLESLQKQLNIWSQQYALLKHEFAMYEKLKDYHYVSELEYLHSLRSLNDLIAHGQQLNSQISEAKESIVEVHDRLKSLYSEAHKNALKELSEKDTQLIQVQHEMEKTKDMIKRSTVRAPVNGTVQGEALSPGNVIPAGGHVLDIVPAGMNLVAETRINPQSIGYVKAGDRVIVKVTAYDFSRYGGINGTLQSLSASTFLDDHKNPYYKARILLSQQYILVDKEKVPLKPGMTVEVSIVTGHKTLLAYLLRPLYAAQEQGFREH